MRLGTVSAWGRTACAFGLPEPTCEEPATAHILWLEGLEASPACDGHLAWVEARDHGGIETHPFRGDCGMPGALWHRPGPGEGHGLCMVPHDGADALSAMEPEPAMEVATA